MTDKYGYDVIVVGAGIGGLTVGNILAKNGMKVLILEKNHAAGGGVSTYYRNGYPIDISHALGAFNEGACLKNMLEYLGVYKKLEFVKLDKTFIFITPNSNKPIFCYADFDRYTQELKSHFPDEIENVKRFFDEIRRVWSEEILRSYYNPSLLLLLLYPFLFPRLFRYRNYTFEQLLNKFIKSPYLKEIISVGWLYLGTEKEYLSALYMICLFGVYQQEGSYFIKGGFGQLISALASNLKDLGGEILLNTEIKKILLNNKKIAYAVRDKKGNVYRANIIVSNADSKRTFLELLDRDCTPKKFLEKINKTIMTKSVVQVHVFAEAEVGREFLSSGSIILPFCVDLEKKLRIAIKSNAQSHEKSVLFLSIHPLEEFVTGSPMNNFVFNIGWYPADYYLWKRYFDSFGKEEYENIKREISQILIGELEKVWKIKNVKFVNVLTPLSMEKWLGATGGAIYDLALIPEQALFNRLKHKTPIKNLYLVGAKTFPGNGMAGGLFSAFALGDIILDGKLTKGKVTLKYHGIR